VIYLADYKNNISPTFKQIEPVLRVNPVLNGILSSSGVKESNDLVEEGKNYAKHQKYDEAADCFKKSIELRPEGKETYLELGKVYLRQEKYSDAASSFEEYLKTYNSDADAILYLGDAYRGSGRYSDAISQYQKASVLEPENDLAKRSLKTAENDRLACIDRQRAQKEKYDTAVANLKQAVAMTKGHLPTGYCKDLSDLTICFDKTAKLSGTSNIAQYEHAKKRITVTSDYIYAAPNIVASYLVHEFVHAKDKDAFTSVKEEQDAFREAAKYWDKNSNGVKDPEMDYVVGLYKQSTESLDARVEEIYKLRDPDIAMTSPNHPPLSSKVAASQGLELSAAGQPIKNYDIIA